jgi:hypothetical protein
MNISLYTPEQEENRFIRRQARAWEHSGLITPGQLAAMDSRTDPELKEPHPFFRILFALFTLVGCGAVIGLSNLLVVTLAMGVEEFSATHAMDAGHAQAFLFLLISLAAYGAAEYFVRVRRWYRHGAEEALTLSAGGLFCVAAAMLLNGRFSDLAVVLTVSLLCAAAAFWLFLRFGFLWAALIGCLALAALPFHMDLSDLQKRIGLWLILAATFLATLIPAGPADEAFRRKRRDLLRAFVFACLYATVNLRLPDLGKSFFSPFPLLPHAGFPPVLYWGSYIMTFLMPAAGLSYGVRARCRPFIVVGAIAAVATLSTNKDYLGMRHYAWDPAILGVLLVAGAAFLMRWLARGEGKSRHGVTAESLLVPETHGIDSAALGAAMAPGFVDLVQPQPQSPSPFEGGQSGGGGARRPY